MTQILCVLTDLNAKNMLNMTLNQMWVARLGQWLLEDVPVDEKRIAD